MRMRTEYIEMGLRVKKIREGACRSALLLQYWPLGLYNFVPDNSSVSRRQNKTNSPIISTSSVSGRLHWDSLTGLQWTAVWFFYWGRTGNRHGPLKTSARCHHRAAKPVKKTFQTIGKREKLKGEFHPKPSSDSLAKVPSMCHTIVTHL